MRREKIQRMDQKAMKKRHDETVESFARRVEDLGIEGLSSGTLLHEPIKFPELETKGRETIDLILIWIPSPKEWEILLFEEKVGPRRIKYGSTELRFAFDAIKRRHWRQWLRSIDLKLPKDCALWVRLVLGYGGPPLLEPFFKEEVRIKIW